MQKSAKQFHDRLWIDTDLVSDKNLFREQANKNLPIYELNLAVRKKEVFDFFAKPP
jgi:hypothetical protein